MSEGFGLEVIREKERMRWWSRSRRWQGRSVALVPTMGFLHEGHLSLIKEARARADLVVVSIYVNPGQFAPSEDLNSYPSDFGGDLRKLKDAGAHAAFCPQNLYDYGGAPPPPASFSSSSELQERETSSRVVSCLEAASAHDTWIRVESLEQGLCGRSRPVFFRGVATIVAKLFNIVEPDVAVFGKKDYQQWRVICRMVRDLDFAIKIIGAEIVREPDGLAMSSRNVRLTREEREKALSISQSLLQAKAVALNGQTTCQDLKNLVTQTVAKAGGRIDYVEIVEQESLIPVNEIDRPVVMCIAAWFGNVRLIDNVEIDI